MMPLLTARENPTAGTFTREGGWGNFGDRAARSPDAEVGAIP